MGEAGETNRRRAGFASHRAIRLALACRALSVAMPVFAYICRYSFETNMNMRRALSERTHRERFQVADNL